MKKLILTIQVTVLILFFAVPAIAGTKAPKELCLQMDDSGTTFYMQFATSKGGKIKHSNNKDTFYHVQGVMSYPGFPSTPCEGSGHITPVGFYPNPSFFSTLHCVFVAPMSGNIFWDLETDTGQVYLGPEGGPADSFPATKVDCKGLMLN